MIHQLTLLKISLDDFEEWLTSASWNMHKDSQPESGEVRRMVGKIELALAEYDDGRKSESQLFSELDNLAGWFKMGNSAQSMLFASSTAQILQFNFQLELSEHVDKRFGMGLSYTPLPAV